MQKPSVLLAFVLGSAVACLGATAPNEPTTPSSRGLDPSNFDTSTPASRDFYQYANGGWLTKNPVPPEYSTYGSFTELAERNLRDQHQLLEDVAAAGQTAKGSTAQLVGDMYASAMDSALVEQLGLAPVQPLLDRIAAVQNRSELPALTASLHRYGVGVFFNLAVDQDPKASAQVIAQLFQAGLGLPDRDYYTKDDARSKTLREEYVKHVAKLLELSGVTAADAAAGAATVMEMETELAKASMTRVEQRDPNAVYHKMTLSAFADAAPGFDWAGYFNEIGRPSPGPLNIGQPEFFHALAAQLASRPLADVKTYLRWHVLHTMSPLLPSAFVQENFHFYGTTMTGAKELRPRWKRALALVNGNVGEALGILYVRKYFSPQAKARALEMVNNLKAAFAERIRSREWMSDGTKVKALAKLDAFQVKIGYPDKWRSYQGLDINRGTLVLNVMRADSFEFQRQLGKLGQPVDRTEWGMTPPTVNAYYNPTMNEIVFPAGILQPPFFDPEADDAVNYGAIGAVIGHEMTHGFDDEGSQFDAKGNLTDWWTPTDKIAFTARQQKVEQQFTKFTVEDSLHVNGKLTLGENIADLGGLTISYAALQKAIAKAKPGLIDGLTPAQRFFLAWAQIWRTNYRPEELRRRLIIDPHSPGMFRTNGPVVNMDEFYSAFGVQESDPMFRPAKDRAKIW